MLCSAVAPAGEGCASLDGTYRNAAEGNKGGYLDDFARMPNGSPDKRLVVYGPLVGNRATKQRFASTATVAWDGKALQLEFHDASGNPIVRYPADWPYPWTCKGTQFEWEYEGVSGVGDNIRETLSRGVLSRHESGDLLLVEETQDAKKKSAASWPST